MRGIRWAKLCSLVIPSNKGSLKTSLDARFSFAETRFACFQAAFGLDGIAVWADDVLLFTRWLEDILPETFRPIWVVFC